MRSFFVVAVGLLLSGSASAADGFAGSWETTFGSMTLTQEGDRVSGAYTMDGERCTIDGKVQKNRLTFHYQEPAVGGEGWFELAADGKNFAGKWRERGSQEWAEWVGRRTAAAPEVSWTSRLLASARGANFAGLWNTSFGRMRLVQEGNKVTGAYTFNAGSAIEGTVEGHKLTLHYKEPNARGEATFTLAADGNRFVGKWNETGGAGGGSWSGERIEPKPGLVWLVVVEARWEANLTDDEYSFGGMLKAFFARSSRVQVRHRFFSDEASLKRWCAEVAYIAEPAVLVVASHGSAKGVEADGKTVPTKALAESLRLAGNLRLLHFSACEVMKGKAAEGIMAEVGKATRFPISGYTTNVDWAASALIEFAYLDMVLMRGMSPAKAAEQLRKMMPFSGINAVPGSVFGNAGFRLLLPE